MGDEVFRELQERLDKYSMGFPATESGVEIEILRKLFTEDDARLFLQLGPMLEPADKIAERSGLDAVELEAKLLDMSKRGLVFRLGRDDKDLYGAIPFVHGLFEFQVKRLDREMAELVGRYFAEGFVKNMIDNADHFLRVVPVGKSVDARQEIATHEDARKIIEDKSPIVVTDCICRKQKSLVSESCGAPLETCFMFGSMAQYYIDNGLGREIGKAEALEILAKAQEAGLVTQPATAQNPAGMCSCCGDCCGVLQSLNLHPRPAEMVFSNHFAAVGEELCTACESCLDRCQMRALSVDGVARVDLDRCIGCGLCVTACPEEAIALARKPEDEVRVPPKNGMEQMISMAKKRGVL